MVSSRRPLAERITPEIVEHVEALAQERKWREVKHLLHAVSSSELKKHPRVSFLLADAYGRLGFPDRAMELAQGAADEFAAAGDERQWLQARKRVGAYAVERGMLQEAESIFLSVIALAEPRGELELVGGALNNLGAIAGMRGAPDEALRHYERALAVGERAGDEQGLARTYYNVALAYRDTGLSREADALFVEAGRRASEIGDEWLAQMAATARAEIRLREDAKDLGAVDVAARQALVRFDVFASTLGQAEAQKLAGMVAASRGDHATAVRRFDDAIALASRHGNPLLAAEAKYERGLARAALGQRRPAAEDFSDAAAMFRELGNEGAAKKAREQLSATATAR